MPSNANPAEHYLETMSAPEGVRGVSLADHWQYTSDRVARTEQRRIAEDGVRHLMGACVLCDLAAPPPFLWV